MMIMLSTQLEWFRLLLQAGRPDFASMTPVHVGYELAAKDFLEDVVADKVIPCSTSHFESMVLASLCFYPGVNPLSLVL